MGRGGGCCSVQTSRGSGKPIGMQGLLTCCPGVNNSANPGDVHEVYTCGVYRCDGMSPRLEVMTPDSKIEGSLLAEHPNRHVAMFRSQRRRHAQQRPGKGNLSKKFSAPTAIRRRQRR